MKQVLGIWSRNLASNENTGTEEKDYLRLQVLFMICSLSFLYPPPDLPFKSFRSNPLGFL